MRTAAYSSMLASMMLGRVVVSALRGVELPLRSLFRATSQTTLMSFPFPPRSSLIFRRLHSTSAGVGDAGRQDAPSANTLEPNRVPFSVDGDKKLPWYCFSESMLPFLNLLPAAIQDGFKLGSRSFHELLALEMVFQL